MTRRRRSTRERLAYTIRRKHALIEHVHLRWALGAHGYSPAPGAVLGAPNLQHTTLTSVAKDGDGKLNIEQVAEIVGAGVSLLGVVLALRAPVCARRNYLRTQALIPVARRLWRRHAIAQECMAYSVIVVGLVTFPFDAFIRLALAASAGVAIFAAVLVEWPGLEVHPTSMRCRQSAEAALRAYGVQRAQEGAGDEAERASRQRTDR